MKSPYVKEIEAGQTVNTNFMVLSKDVRQKKSGDPFLSLILSDKTGELDAMMWDNVAEILETFEKDDFVKVRGLVQIFQNRPQMTIHKLQRVPDSEVELADYYPCSKRDQDEMLAEVRGIVAAIANPNLRGLLEAFFNDAEIAQLYKVAPAAKTIHHAWLGGLIEHVLSMCTLAKAVAPHYPHIDGDLLLTGVLLHDIGKIHELTYARGFGYSSDGQLLGHIIQALRMLDDKIRLVPGFPPKVRVLVEHMIVSHHGELEYGSPKVPLFPEALLLHHLDNLDSKMEAMRGLIDNDRQVEGVFTGYNNALERAALKKAKYLDDSPAAPKPAVNAAPPVSKDNARKPSSSPFAEKLIGALKPNA